jgi:hypothetical protein
MVGSGSICGRVHGSRYLGLHPPRAGTGCSGSPKTNAGVHMKKNVGNRDRAIRYVLAGICLIVPIFVDVAQPVQIGLYVAAVALAATASIGFCGAYTIFGINTCAVKENAVKENAVKEK